VADDRIVPAAPGAATQVLAPSAASRWTGRMRGGPAGRRGGFESVVCAREST